MTIRRTALATLLGTTLATVFALPAAAQMELKLGHVGGPGSLFELSANEFARRANEKLGNKAKVVVFGSSQLGSDSELMQKLRLGTVEFAIPSSVMSSTVDAFGMFEMPYLVKNREHMKKIEAEIVWPTLAPMADFVLDFHSGGRTLDFVPFAAAHRLEAKMQEEACIAAMRAFNAPYSMVLLEIDNVGMFDTTVEALGKVFVSTELGGGGTATARSIAIARKGVRNFLIHAGIHRGEAEAGPSVDLDMPDGDCFVFAEHDGLIEPLADLGDMVEKGAEIARVWPVERTGAAPVIYRARRGGLLTARHFPGLVKSGDCLAVTAVVVE